MPVQVICWNIKNFAHTGVMANAAHVTRILDVVHPAVGRAYNIFVIIEPSANGTAKGTDAAGGGTTGALQLLGALRARANGGSGWNLVPTMCLKRDGKNCGETIAVFYHTVDIEFRGPGERVLGKEWAHAALKGDVYWIDTSVTPPEIVSAPLGGVAGAGLAMPAAEATAMVIDIPGGRVCYADARTNEVASCSLTALGAATQIWQPAHTSSPAMLRVRLAAMAVPQAIYWIEENTGAILRADLPGKAIHVVERTAGAEAIAVTASWLLWQSLGGITKRDLANPANPDAAVGVTLELARSCAVGDRVYWLDASEDLRSYDPASDTVALLGRLPALTGLHAAGAVLYGITATGDVHSVDLGNLGAGAPLVFSPGPTSSFCASSAYLYWVDGAGDVQRSDLAGANPQTVVDHAGATPQHLCAAASLLAWRDARNNANVVVVADQGGGQPKVAHGLVRSVHVAGTKAYWIDVLDQAIHWADADGSGNHGYFPTFDDAGAHRLDAAALAVDVGSGDMYWTTATAIRRINAGTGACDEVVDAAHCGEPSGLAITGDRVLWSDAAVGHERIRRVRISNFNNRCDQVVGGLSAGPRLLALSPQQLNAVWVDANHDIYLAGAGKYVSGNGPGRHGLGRRVAQPGVAIGAVGVHVAGNHIGAALRSAGQAPAPAVPTWVDDQNVSCPFLARFREPGGNEFDLIAHHAPNPTDHNRIPSATEIAIVAANPTTAQWGANVADVMCDRLMYMGDLNLCGMGINNTIATNRNETGLIYAGSVAAQRKTIPDNPRAVDCGGFQKGTHESNWVALYALGKGGIFDTHNGGPWLGRVAGVTSGMVVWNKLSSFKKLAGTKELVSPGGTNPANWRYLAHAYDHILAREFTHGSIANNDVVDLVASELQSIAANPVGNALVIAALGHATAANRKTAFRDHVLRHINSLISNSANAAQKGISDHLPVATHISF
jgi:hypothetical protein